MLELGIIEVSTSEWCSPVVLVSKKDASLRFSIDFRYLNAFSNFDPYPMPRADDLLERVGGSSYITTLDLAKGYWQLALTTEARELTAFRTPFGLYQLPLDRINAIRPAGGTSHFPEAHGLCAEGCVGVRCRIPGQCGGFQQVIGGTSAPPPGGLAKDPGSGTYHQPMQGTWAISSAMGGSSHKYRRLRPSALSRCQPPRGRSGVL